MSRRLNGFAEPLRLELATYAAGSLATGMFATVPLVLLLFYCTEVLGLPAALSTGLVAVPKLIAIAWDPLVGAWLDRRGDLRRAMIIGAAGVCFGLGLLFASPQLPVTGMALWVGFSFALLVFSASLFAVPYIALPALIAPSAKGRTRFVTWRMTASMIGVLTGGALAPALVDMLGGDRAAYKAMGLVVALLCGGAMAAVIADIRLPVRQAKAPSGLWRQMRRIFTNAGFRRLAIAYVLQLTAVGGVSAALPYIVTRALGRDVGDAGIYMGALLLVTVVSVPFWSRLGYRFGERRCLAIAAAMYVIALAGFALSVAGTPTFVALPAFALIGWPLAGLQVLPFALVAHMAHAGSREVPIEVALTGAWTAVEKLGLACGPGLAGLTLAVFPTSAELPAALLLGPAVLAMASILPLLPQHAQTSEV